MPMINELVEGLSLLISLKKVRPIMTTAEHDIIYIGGLNRSDIPNEQWDKLVSLGFHWDSDLDCPAYFT